MRCSYCGSKIKRTGRSSGTGRSDAVQACPRAADYGRWPGTPCQVTQSHIWRDAPPATGPRYNRDVARLDKRRGPRKRYGRGRS